MSPSINRERTNALDLSAITPEIHAISKCSITGGEVDRLHIVQDGDNFELNITCHGHDQFRTVRVEKSNSPLEALMGLAKGRPFCTPESVAGGGGEPAADTDTPTALLLSVPYPELESIGRPPEVPSLTTQAQSEICAQHQNDAWRVGFADGFAKGLALSPETLSPSVVGEIVTAIAKGREKSDGE